MAHRFENRDGGVCLVLDGFENGIADSPLDGIALLKNVDVTGVPKQASVAFENVAMTVPPTVNAVAFTSNATADTITVTDATGYYNGMAIVLNTVVTSTGITTGRVYWIGDLSGNTFKVYKNPSRNAGQVVDIATGNGSGTLSSYTMGKIIGKTVAFQSGSAGTATYQFFIDENGRVWWRDNTGGTVTNNMVYLGNDTLTGSNGRNIAIFKNNIIVFRESTTDALHLDSLEGSYDLDASYAVGGGGWRYGWESISSITTTKRAVFVGQDDVLYYANDNRIGSISENAGSTFDPTTGATYTENVSALDIPSNDDVVSIGEVGTTLLIGGVKDIIYPWDRVSSSFDFPIRVPESKITHILSTNNLAYVLAGFSGSIYVTNGSSVELFKKIPDHVTEEFSPHFSMQDIEIDNDQLYVSFKAFKNDGTAITATDGVWAIDRNTGTLRLTVTPTTAGVVTMIAKDELSDTPKGQGIVVAWETTGGSVGMDTGTSNPFNGGESVIVFDLVSMGSNKFPITPTQFEVKLTRPLVSGESIELQQRTSGTGLYTTIATFSTAGVVSGSNDTTVENTELLQVKAILTSTHTTPSHVPLREVAIYLP